MIDRDPCRSMPSATAETSVLDVLDLDPLFQTPSCRGGVCVLGSIVICSFDHLSMGKHGFAFDRAIPSMSSMHHRWSRG